MARRGVAKGRMDCVEAGEGKERAYRFEWWNYILTTSMSFHILGSNMTGTYFEG